MELLARWALTVASVVLAGSLLMLPATRAGSPERAITLFTLAGGLMAVAAAVLAAVLIRRRRHGTD